MVERATKNAGLSFLDKFEGKTSKMGKHGITALIEFGSQQPTPPTISTTSNSKRPSGKSQANAAYREKLTTCEVVQSKYD